VLRLVSQRVLRMRLQLGSPPVLRLVLLPVLRPGSQRVLLPVLRLGSQRVSPPVLPPESLLVSQRLCQRAWLPSSSPVPQPSSWRRAHRPALAALSGHKDRCRSRQGRSTGPAKAAWTILQLRAFGCRWSRAEAPGAVEGWDTDMSGSIGPKPGIFQPLAISQALIA
jgi:hypothetical protein